MRGGKPIASIYDGLSGKLAKGVDAVVGLFAPGLAHSMQKRRMQSSAMLSYEAAVVDRLMPKERAASADSDLIQELPTIRARSRRQTNNDGHAASAAEVYVDAVVGDGIKPMCGTTVKNSELDEEGVREWRDACEAYFAKWSEEMADASGDGTFYDIQALVARTRKVDGECFTHAVVGGDRTLSIEVIDADRIGTPEGKRDTIQLRAGIEVDAKGRATAYHVANAHPDDVDSGGQVTYTRVEPKEGELYVMQHHRRKGRAGQSRGIPDGASSAQYLEHLHNYLHSEIVGARAAANYAMFIKKSVTATDADIFPVQGGSGDNTQEFHEAIEPATIAYLNEGEEPFAFTPNRPGASDVFVIRMLRAVAASHGMSYERMSRNWAGMNYSSMRGQLKEESRGFSRDRKLLERQFCTPWYRNVIRHGIQTGDLTPPAAYLNDPTPFLAVIWIAPAEGWVDPTKEVKSSKEAIDANLSTHWHEISRTGLDPEEVLERKAQFYARAAALEGEYNLAPGSLTGGVVVSNTESDDAAGVDSAGEIEDEDGTTAPSPDEDDASDESKDDESEVPAGAAAKDDE
jgi:lambda family phage portal protein